jgi:hypothetical protein
MGCHHPPDARGDAVNGRGTVARMPVVTLCRGDAVNGMAASAGCLW